MLDIGDTLVDHVGLHNVALGDTDVVDTGGDELLHLALEGILGPSVVDIIGVGDVGIAERIHRVGGLHLIRKAQNSVGTGLDGLTQLHDREVRDLGKSDIVGIVDLIELAVDHRPNAHFLHLGLLEFTLLITRQALGHGLDLREDDGVVDHMAIRDEVLGALAALAHEEAGTRSGADPADIARQLDIGHDTHDALTRFEHVRLLGRGAQRHREQHAADHHQAQQRRAQPFSVFQIHFSHYRGDPRFSFLVFYPLH